MTTNILIYLRKIKPSYPLCYPYDPYGPPSRCAWTGPNGGIGRGGTLRVRARGQKLTKPGWSPASNGAARRVSPATWVSNLDGIIVDAMKTVIDDLPVVLASRLRAAGVIGRETKTTIIKFDGSDVEFVVEVTSKWFSNGGDWALFRCASTGRGSNPLDRFERFQVTFPFSFPGLLLSQAE